MDKKELQTIKEIINTIKSMNVCYSQLLSFMRELLEINKQLNERIKVLEFETFGQDCVDDSQNEIEKILNGMNSCCS